jgi:diacylglycerol O-acyltransferase / wax synthase
MLGAELTSVYPAVPITADHALSIGIFTHRAHAHFGLYADPEAFPDVRRLPGLLDREVATLADPAMARCRRRRGRGRVYRGEVDSLA